MTVCKSYEIVRESSTFINLKGNKKKAHQEENKEIFLYGFFFSLESGIKLEAFRVDCELFNLDFVGSESSSMYPFLEFVNFV
jgi:hypothetical protein